MVPSSEKKSYLAIQDNTLISVPQKEKKSDIHSLAKFALSHLKTVSYENLFSIQDLFQKKCDSHFLFRIWDRIIGGNLNNKLHQALQEKGQSLDLTSLVELVPEFRKIQEEKVKNSIRLFLQDLPLSPEKEQSIRNSLLQGSLEGVFSYLRSHLELKKTFPELIQQAFAFRGEVPNNEEEQTRQPTPDLLLSEFTLCFRQLMKSLRVIDRTSPEETCQLYATMAKLRPAVLGWLKEQEAKQTLQASKNTPPTISLAVQKQMEAILSPAHLLLRAIDLLEARTRLVARSLLQNPPTSSSIKELFQKTIPLQQTEHKYRPVVFFMPELGMPPTTGKTFTFIQETKTNKLFLEAENPVGSEPVLLSVKEDTLEPLDEKTITPRLVAAWHLVQNKSYSTALQLLPLSLSVPFTFSENDKKLLQMIWDSLCAGKNGPLRRNEWGVDQLALRLSTIAQQKEKEQILNLSSYKETLASLAAEYQEETKPTPLPSTTTQQAPHLKPPPKIPREPSPTMTAPLTEEQKERINELFPVGRSQKKNSPEAKPQVQEEYAFLASVAARQVQKQPLPQAQSRIGKEIEALTFSDLSEKTRTTALHTLFEERATSLTKEYETKKVELLQMLVLFDQPEMSIEELMILYAQHRLSSVFTTRQTKTLTSKLIAYMNARQEIQKMDRVRPSLEELLSSKTLESFTEKKEALIEEIERKRSYEPPEKYPTYQVFEVLMDVLIRKGQWESLEKLNDPNKSAIIQLLMGQGKTYILLPLLALLRANGSNIATVMLPESLLREVSYRLRTVLGRGFDQLVTEIKLPSPSEITLSDLQDILQKLNDVRVHRGCLLMSPNDKHLLRNCFTHFFTEWKKNPTDLEGQRKVLMVTEILSTLSKTEAVVGDEVDDLLKTNLEYIIALGKSKPFDTTDSSLISELVFESLPVAHKEGILLDFAPSETSAKMPCTIELFHEKIKPPLVEKALLLLQEEKIVPQEEVALWKNLLKGPAKAFIKKYLESKDRDTQDVQKAFDEVSRLDPKLRDRLAGVWFSLNHVLPTSYYSEWNKDHGLKEGKGEVIARPFGGAGFATETQYNNPYEQVARTIQVMIKQGPPESALNEFAIGKAKKAIEQLFGKDPEKKASFLTRFKTLCQSVKTPKGWQTALQQPQNRDDFRLFLQLAVFPKAEEHPAHIASTPHNLVDSSLSFSGMTGTFWNVSTMPGFEHIHPDIQREVQTLLRLQEKEKAHEIDVVLDEEAPQSALLEKALYPKTGDKPLALIDSGGWLRSIPTETLATELLQKRSDLTTIFFYDHEENLMVLEKGKSPRKKTAQDDAIPLDTRFTIYDMRHTFGADIPQEENAKAILTMGKEMILRDFEQGIIRMRQMEKHQRCTILVDTATIQAMKERLGETPSATLSTVIRFLITTQVLRKLQDNYHSTQQRVQNALETTLRRAIYRALQKHPPDFATAEAIFDKGKTFFVQEETGSPWERYGQIPTKILTKQKIEKEIAQYEERFKEVSQVKEVQAILQEEGKSARDIIAQCYSSTQYEETSLDHDPSSLLGRTCFVQNAFQEPEEETSLSLELQREVSERLTTLSQQYPSCELIQACVNKAQSPSVSPQELASLMIQEERLSRLINDFALLQTEAKAYWTKAPNTGLQDRLRKNWESLSKTVLETFSDTSMKQARAFLHQTKELLEAIHTHEAIQTKGRESVAKSRFKGEAPPFGQMRTWFEKGASSLKALEKVLGKSSLSFESKPLLTMTKTLQKETKETEEALSSLEEAETEDFSEQIEEDKERLNNLVDALKEKAPHLRGFTQKAIDTVANALQTANEQLNEREIASPEEYCRLVQDLPFDEAERMAEAIEKKRRAERHEKKLLQKVPSGHVSLQAARQSYEQKLASAQTEKAQTALENVPKELYRIEALVQEITSQTEKQGEKLHAFEERLKEPHLQSLLSKEWSSLQAERSRFLRHLQEVTTTSELDKCAVLVEQLQAERTEIERLTKTLSLNETKINQLRFLLSKANTLTPQDFRTVLTLLKEVCVEKKLLPFDKLLSSPAWHTALSSFLDALSTKKELFSETASFITESIPQKEQQTALILRVLGHLQETELASFEKNCTEAHQQFLGEQSLSGIESRFQSFVQAITQAKENALVSFHRMLQETDALSQETKQELYTKLNAAYQDHLSILRLQGSRKLAPLYTMDLEKQSLNELEKRSQILGTFIAVLERATVGEEETYLSLSAKETLQLFTTAQQKIDRHLRRETSRLHIQQGLAKAKQIGLQLIEHGSLIGLTFALEAILPENPALRWIAAKGLAQLKQAAFKKALRSLDTLAQPALDSFKKILPQQFHFLLSDEALAIGTTGTACFSDSLYLRSGAQVLRRKFLLSSLNKALKPAVASIQRHIRPTLQPLAASTGQMTIGAVALAMTPEDSLAHETASALFESGYRQAVHVATKQPIATLTSNLPASLQPASKALMETGVTLLADCLEEKAEHAAASLVSRGIQVLTTPTVLPTKPVQEAPVTPIEKAREKEKEAVLEGFRHPQKPTSLQPTTLAELARQPQSQVPQSLLKKALPVQQVAKKSMPQKQFSSWEMLRDLIKHTLFVPGALKKYELPSDETTSTTPD